MPEGVPEELLPLPEDDGRRSPALGESGITTISEIILPSALSTVIKDGLPSPLLPPELVANASWADVSSPACVMVLSPNVPGEV